MKKEAIFMMIFRFTPDFTYQPTAQEQAEMKEQWGTFIGNIAISEKLVSTYQLGFEGTQIKADRSKEHDILLTEGQTLGGNMIVKANSLEEASALAMKCPILNMGGSVEIRNILPMDA